MDAKREPTNRDLHDAIERLSAQVEKLTELVRGRAGEAPNQSASEVSVTASFGLVSLKAKTTPAAIIGWVQSCFRSKRFGIIDWNDQSKCYPDGYLNEDGIQYLVDEMFKELDSPERYIKSFVLFEDRSQWNWLAATPNYILYILDKKQRTKSCNDNIKWMLPKERRGPVVVNKRAGKVSIGPFIGWLYSEGWHKTAKGLKSKIEEL